MLHRHDESDVVASTSIGTVYVIRNAVKVLELAAPEGREPVIIAIV